MGEWPGDLLLSLSRVLALELFALLLWKLALGVPMILLVDPIEVLEA